MAEGRFGAAEHHQSLAWACMMCSQLSRGNGDIASVYSGALGNPTIQGGKSHDLIVFCGCVFAHVGMFILVDVSTHVDVLFTPFVYLQL